MFVENCNACVHTECADHGNTMHRPCNSFKTKIEVVEKKRGLVPTMNLRLVQSNRNEINPPVLQQQFKDRNVINKDGTAGGEQWIDVPVVTL